MRFWYELTFAVDQTVDRRPSMRRVMVRRDSSLVQRIVSIVINGLSALVVHAPSLQNNLAGADAGTDSSLQLV